MRAAILRNVAGAAGRPQRVWDDLAPKDFMTGRWPDGTVTIPAAALSRIESAEHLEDVLVDVRELALLVHDLNDWMDAQGLTQAAVARRFRINRNVLGQLRHGEQFPEWSTFGPVMGAVAQWRRAKEREAKEAAARAAERARRRPPGR